MTLESVSNTTMTACVICAECANRLMVCDCATGQKVLVHTSQARCFCPGELVRIEYSGAMTMSIPPQISAQEIERAHCC